MNLATSLLPTKKKLNKNNHFAISKKPGSGSVYYKGLRSAPFIWSAKGNQFKFLFTWIERPKSNRQHSQGRQIKEKHKNI